MQPVLGNSYLYVVHTKSMYDSCHLHRTWVLCSQYLVIATSTQSTQKHVRCTMTTTQNLGLIQPGFGKSYLYIGHTKNLYVALHLHQHWALCNQYLVTATLT